MLNSQISSHLSTETRAIELAKLDDALSQLLDSLENTLFEDDQSDSLVSKLQDTIGSRQTLITQLVSDEQQLDRSYIQKLAESSQEFGLRARNVLADREALLGVLRKGRRQTNLYKTIGSNR
ncbi:flagella biosynthesis chaperone for FliD, FliT [Shewanella sp. 125m-7]